MSSAMVQVSTVLHMEGGMIGKGGRSKGCLLSGLVGLDMSSAMVQVSISKKGKQMKSVYKGWWLEQAGGAQVGTSLHREGRINWGYQESCLWSTGWWAQNVICNRAGKHIGVTERQDVLGIPSLDMVICSSLLFTNLDQACFCVCVSPPSTRRWLAPRDWTRSSAPPSCSRTAAAPLTPAPQQLSPDSHLLITGGTHSSPGYAHTLFSALHGPLPPHTSAAGTQREPDASLPMLICSSHVFPTNPDQAWFCVSSPFPCRWHAPHAWIRSSAHPSCSQTAAASHKCNWDPAGT